MVSQGLCFSKGGQRHFLSRLGPASKVDAFRGLKTRIVPIPLHKAIWERLGANPVGIPYAEVYTSLQTRVIDAVEFNISSIAADKVYEQANQLTLTGHDFWPGAFYTEREVRLLSKRHPGCDFESLSRAYAKIRRAYQVRRAEADR